MTYHVATETRNNVHAAIQNLESMHRYLDNIHFPYCTPDECRTVTRAMNNIYTGYNHVTQC